MGVMLSVERPRVLWSDGMVGVGVIRRMDAYAERRTSGADEADDDEGHDIELPAPGHHGPGGPPARRHRWRMALKK